MNETQRDDGCAMSEALVDRLAREVGVESGFSAEGFDKDGLPIYLPYYSPAAVAAMVERAVAEEREQCACACDGLAPPGYPSYAGKIIRARKDK